MSLSKPRPFTPARLAANRLNARASTGPRTAAGKGRSALNALKHGRYAKKLRENLARAHQHEDVELYDWIADQVSGTFHPAAPEEWRQARQLAGQVWCWGRWARRRARLGTNPRSALESTDTSFMFLSRIARRMRLRIDDRRTKRHLVFWVRRRRGMVRPRRLVRCYPDVAAWLLARSRGREGPSLMEPENSYITRL